MSHILGTPFSSLEDGLIAIITMVPRVDIRISSEILRVLGILLDQISF